MCIIEYLCSTISNRFVHRTHFHTCDLIYQRNEFHVSNFTVNDELALSSISSSNDNTKLIIEIKHNMDTAFIKNV